MGGELEAEGAGEGAAGAGGVDDVDAGGGGGEGCALVGDGCGVDDATAEVREEDALGCSFGAGEACADVEAVGSDGHVVEGVAGHFADAGFEVIEREAIDGGGVRGDASEVERASGLFAIFVFDAIAGEVFSRGVKGADGGEVNGEVLGG